jgi:hypothetical protein
LPGWFSASAVEIHDSIEHADVERHRVGDGRKLNADYLHQLALVSIPRSLVASETAGTERFVDGGG